MAVRWYLRYGLSYRDVEELLAEIDMTVDHVTVYRWAQRFTPEFIETARLCRHASQVRWVAREDGDGLGFDIQSYDTQGRLRHIEATAFGPETPFYLSSAELDSAQRTTIPMCCTGSMTCSTRRGFTYWKATSPS